VKRPLRQTDDFQIVKDHANGMLHFSRKLPTTAEKSRHKPIEANSFSDRAPAAAESCDERNRPLRLGGYLLLLLTGSEEI
jgi:hypothetical protein